MSDPITCISKCADERHGGQGGTHAVTIDGDMGALQIRAKLNAPRPLDTNIPLPSDSPAMSLVEDKVIGDAVGTLQSTADTSTDVGTNRDKLAPLGGDLVRSSPACTLMDESAVLAALKALDALPKIPSRQSTETQCLDAHAQRNDCPSSPSQLESPSIEELNTTRVPRSQRSYEMKDRSAPANYSSPKQLKDTGIPGLESVSAPRRRSSVGMDRSAPATCSSGAVWSGPDSHSMAPRAPRRQLTVENTDLDLDESETLPQLIQVKSDGLSRVRKQCLKNSKSGQSNSLHQSQQYSSPYRLSRKERRFAGDLPAALGGKSPQGSLPPRRQQQGRRHNKPCSLSPPRPQYGATAFNTSDLLGLTHGGLRSCGGRMQAGFNPSPPPQTQGSNGRHRGCPKQAPTLGAFSVSQTSSISLDSASCEDDELSNDKDRPQQSKLHLGEPCDDKCARPPVEFVSVTTEVKPPQTTTGPQCDQSQQNGGLAPVFVEANSTTHGTRSTLDAEASLTWAYDPNTGTYKMIPMMTPAMPWLCVCGQENEADFIFCGMCATPQRWTCPECQFSKNKCRFPHCGGCGTQRAGMEALRPPRPTVMSTVESIY